MTNKVHLKYYFEKETKFSYYETLWKLTALDLLGEVLDTRDGGGKAKVLDVGSGRGEMLLLLSSRGYDAEGVDADAECVRLSSQHGVCKQGDVRELANLYPAESFDAIMALHVLEHLDNPRQCIEQFRLVSKQYLLLATPNLSSLAFLNWGRKISRCNQGHTCGWNYAHFNNFLTNICGLRVVRWKPDCVPLYNTLPYMGWLDHLFHKSGIRAIIEERLLKKLFPHLSYSLIVLCEK